MTAEERIAYLEAALALERAKVHELSAALAEAVSADAHAKRVAADRKAARSLQNRAAYERRKQESAQIQRAESGAETTAETPSPPPPFPSSFPPSPAPSSPYPLSFPPSSPPPSASQEPAAPERPPFALEAQKPGKQPRKPSAAEHLFASLQAMRAARCEEVGEPWVEEKWPHARRNRDLKPLVEAPSEAQALFEAAWGLYLADDGERVREPAWSLSWFMASGVRARYETRAARGEGA